MTLCGRPRAEVVADAMTWTCWAARRSGCAVLAGASSRGGWSRPPAAEGEDAVLRWVINAVLESGEALIEGVPVPRLEAFRRRVRSELKAMMGGSVHTSRIGAAVLWVRSGLVPDAKTPERWQEEMHSAVRRMEDVEAGRPVEPARWRGRWLGIIEIGD